jgi:adenine-specific DNA-methyltransferase
LELLRIFKNININKESLLDEPEKNYKKIKGQLELDLEDESQKSKLIDTLNSLTKSEGITEELKDKIYNHILGFFQMYYSNGDFGYNDRSRDLYKVPYEADYNGSDTMFHWKHKGSLYIKTGTSFNAIKFELKGEKIEYRLETNENSEDEGTSQNNNKDSQLKHYRFDRIEKIKDKATKENIYQVVFNLSDASTSKVAIFKAIYEKVFNNKNIDKYLQYESIKKDGTHEIKTVFTDLTKDFDKVQNGQINGLSALRETKKKIADSVKLNFIAGQTKSGNNQYEKIFKEDANEFTHETLKTIYTLDQKLNSFYIGNDADYFIHENLNEFLTNEKNRFVKNYIFDDLESIYNGKLDNTTLLIAKAFDKVSTRIIEFLSTIEDFQKHLFTKKKKVVESEYCITVDYIDENYYQEILDNKTQLQEWQNLFSLDVKSIEDIKANPTLVVDTKCFKQADGTNPFKDKILSEIDDLDDKTNGLLINSENYQALEVLENKYRSKIDTIYIDPPYNSPSSSIIYKNNFKHSSWATLMFNRIKKAKSLLKSKGCEIIAIDENEQNNLFQIVSEVYPINNYDNVLITVEHNKKGIQGDHFSYSSEFAIFSIPFELKKINSTALQNDEWEWSSLRNWGGESLRTDAKNCFYPIIVDDKMNIVDFGEVSKDKFHPAGPNVILDEKRIAIYPIDKEGVERKWRYADNTVKDIIDKLKVVKDKNGVFHIRLAKISKDFKTIWNETKYNAGDYGTKVLTSMGFDKKDFDFPKSVDLVYDCIFTNDNGNNIIIDFFAGSGTTGHSVIKMNKNIVETGNNRKYILVEMGKYFSKVTKPRIQKVIYSENWKNGKPLDSNGSPKHIFKYQVLEQYEDVLDNLKTIEYKGKYPDNLPIKYLYKPEENSLESNLDLYNPFFNQYECGQPSVKKILDLVETYNYIQGYFIKSIKTFELNKKYYKVVETTIGVIVIWRDISIDEDDSKQVVEIASKYDGIHTLEINAEFATLKLDKANHLEVGEELIELKIISKDVFNQ